MRKFNRKLESLIGLLDTLVKRLIPDLLEVFSSIGLKGSPLESHLASPGKPELEGDILKYNLSLFPKMLDYFREATECFFILCRSKKAKIYQQNEMQDILQLLERSRYTCGTAIEQLFLIEGEVEYRLADQNASKDKLKRKQILTKSKDDLIKDLYKKKLRTEKDAFKTRESKVNLQKETSSKAYDFLHNGVFEQQESDKEWKNQIQESKMKNHQLRTVSSYLDDVLDSMAQVRKIGTLKRVQFLQRLLKEVRFQSNNQGAN